MSTISLKHVKAGPPGICWDILGLDGMHGGQVQDHVVQVVYRRCGRQGTLAPCHPLRGVGSKPRSRAVNRLSIRVGFS